MLMACGLMEKVESGELLAHYSYNDANADEEPGYSGEVPLIVMKNKDGEKVFISVNDDIEDLIDKHNYDGRDWSEWRLDY